MLPSFCTCSCPSDWWKPRALRHYDIWSMSFDHRYRDVHMSRTPHVLIDSMTLTRRNHTSNASDLYNCAVHSTSFSFVQMLKYHRMYDWWYYLLSEYNICNMQFIPNKWRTFAANTRKIQYIPTESMVDGPCYEFPQSTFSHNNWTVHFVSEDAITNHSICSSQHNIYSV